MAAPAISQQSNIVFISRCINNCNFTRRLGAKIRINNEEKLMTTTKTDIIITKNAYKDLYQKKSYHLSPFSKNTKQNLIYFILF